MTTSDRLYAEAVRALSTDPTPYDTIDDDVACVDSVTALIRRIDPNFPRLSSTVQLFNTLQKRARMLSAPKKGCLVLSVTGTGNGRVANGHVGVVGARISGDGTLWIMSNNSFTGLWSVTHTVKTWNRYYNALGGMETYYFELY